ncbi:MAG TPA: amino acid ABC transporter permease [Clostridiales bacterium]|jgi:His/Glu/Gln/Arg/opine family amino acid ABC transporter permease subunit|nr:amino acid ABC transporter permease [Clostridiales bacterium]
MNIFSRIIEFFSGGFSRIVSVLFGRGRWMLIVNGLKVTLLLSFFSVIIGTVIGTVVALIKVAYVNRPKSKVLKALNTVATLYVNVVRGTPTVVQLLIMNFVVFASSSNMILIAVLTFGINSGAYVSEVMRAGINAVDYGQTEAGRSLGLSEYDTMKEIVLPQAIKNILPALGNEFITLIKETSIAGYIALQDLTKAGDLIRFATYEAFIPLITVALIYLVIVLGLTKLVSMLERRLAKSDNRR